MGDDLLTKLEVLVLVQKGAWTPQKAEAWAKRCGLPPFAGKPDAASYDPREELNWTLCMALIWIASGDLAEVREAWPEWLSGQRVWHEFVDGGKRWWSLGPPQRREDYSRWEGYEVDPRTAVKGLWRALETGEIVATGISKCEGVRRVAFGCIAEGHGRKMHPNRDKVNVLLVDDQPSKLLSYEVILEELGENLIKAASGKEALAQLLRREFAVILVDVAMPELDGFELAAMIREHPRFEQTAIIFVSAVHLSEFDSLRGYQAGAVDYLPVPIVPDLLRAKVRIFCDLYRKTRQLEALNEELERRVEARTAELAAANADLEKRVDARTREREEALAQVAEMQKLESLGQLTGGVAHDFNNLLMVIMSNLEMALNRVAEDGLLTRWLGRAMEAATRGAALTKRMLAFARRQDLKPESLALSDVVKGMVEMMSHSLGPSVRIAVDLPPDLPPVRIDRNQLELAVLNLGLNARDAMPNGGIS